MKTSIRKSGNSVIISLGGILNYETTDSLKDNLAKLSSEHTNSQVIFDLGELQFVGSSGISSFVQTLRDFNLRLNSKPVYTNVKSEFMRIMSAFDETGSFEFNHEVDLDSLNKTQN